MISDEWQPIGRTAELRRLRMTWDRTAQGRSTVVAVEGPSGIGKTSLIRAFIQALGPAVTVRRAGGSAGFSAPLGVFERLSGFSVDAAADPFLLGRRLAASLPGAAVLVVDDAQHADPRSLTALRHTLAAVRGRVMLLVAGGAEVFPGSETLELGGLSVEELAELAVAASPEGRRLPVEAARRLHERTGGNPLFAVQLLKQSSARQLAGDVGLPAAPTTVERAVLENLASLAPATGLLLGIGAVLGRRFSLAAVLDVDPSLTLDVNGALASGLVEEDGAGLVFVSEDVRATVYRALPRARRKELHRAAVRLGLEDSVCHRLAAADPPDPEAAAAVFAFARERYRHGAVYLAAQYMRAALELVPRSSAARRPLLLETVEGLLISGDVVGASAFEAEIAGLPEGAWRDYVLGYLRLLHADVAGSSTSLNAALTRDPDGPADLRSRIHTQLAVLAIVSLDQEGMRRHGSLAIGLESADPALTSFAWFAWAIGLALGGEPERALRELASSPALRGNLDALAARGMIRLWTGDLDGASGDLREVVERAMRGETLRIAQAFAFLSEVRYRQGRLDDSIRLARWAVDDALHNERVWDYALVHALAVYPLAARGRFVEAVECATTASKFAWTDVGRAYAVGAWAAIAQARPDSPARLLSLARDLDATGYASVEPGTHLFAALTSEALAVNNLASTLVPLPTRDSARMTSLRAHGAVLSARGDHAAAVDRLFEALTLAEPMPLEAVKIRLLLARPLDALGRRREAAEVLRAALTQARALSADAYAAQAESMLEARAPGRPETLAVLTGRQRAVAELALDGLTRRQIADRLDRSLKVVEGHFTAIFKRLGISSTVELREMFGR